MVLMILPGFSGHWKIIRWNRKGNLVVKCFVKCLQSGYFTSSFKFRPGEMLEHGSN